MWHVLGFTLDDSVWWQLDSALAGTCRELWIANARPADVAVYMCRPYESFVSAIFLSAAAARTLDDANIAWREHEREQISVLPAHATLLTEP